MQSTRKRVVRQPPAEATAASPWYAGLAVQARAWAVETRAKLRDLPKTNFELGCRFAREGRWMDAALRFRVTLYLQPNYPKAWYNLACCQFQQNKPASAVLSLKQALAQNPSHAEAILMLAALAPEAVPVALRPQHIPPAMVVDFFTGLAGFYDAQELRDQYQGGQLVHAQVAPLVATSGLRVVDLGCGTGIASRPWRAAAAEIVGVDLTPAMVEAGAQVHLGSVRLLDHALVGDASALPEGFEHGTADLVLAVNLSPFVGELSGLLAGASFLLHTEGIFALTLEPYTAAQAGFGVRADTGRFGHRTGYARQVAAQYGLVAVKETPLALYPGSDAQLLVFRKEAA